MQYLKRIINRIDKKELILVLACFSYLFYITMRKLTVAPLWLDETLEYYISKYMVGDVSWYSNNGVTVARNMYERMLGAFQPPLYNFVMYFWLLISETEWWFRFSGVIMSLLAAAGIYKTVKRFSTYYIASLAVLIYSCIYQVIYYTQECGEYVMQLMFLAWLFYFYFELMSEFSTRRMLLFVIFSILNVYTQYGAVFIVIPLSFSVMIYVYSKKEMKELYQLLISYAVAIILGALPLLLFFTIPQLRNQTSMTINPESWNFYNNNIFSDLLQMFLDVFRWSTIESMSRFYWVAFFSSMFLICLGIFYYIKGKNIFLKHLLICNVITWFLYYLPTRAGIYGRGYFGFRYNIFFIPMWLITILYLFYETYNMLYLIKNDDRRSIFKRCYQIILIAGALGYCIYGTHQIRKHWEKSDTRGCVQQWYEKEGYELLTIVEPGQVPSFSYYYEHNEKYNKKFDSNIIREKSKTPENVWSVNQYDIEYQLYLEEMNKRFQDGWPDEIYCFVGDIENNPLIGVFKNEGYKIEEIYRTTAQLYYLHK